VRHRPRISARPRHAFRRVSRDRFFTILISRAGQEAVQVGGERMQAKNRWHIDLKGGGKPSA